jgi:hypothetical protein
MRQRATAPFIVLLLLLASRVGMAQSCPAFDSLSAGTPTRRDHFKVTYDRVADTTYYWVDSKIANAPMMSDNVPDYTLDFFIEHEGRSAGHFQLGLRVTTDLIAKDAHDRVEDRAAMNQVEQVAIMADDSVRIRLDSLRYTARSKASVLTGRTLEERLVVLIPLADWARISRASKLLVRIGAKDVTMGSGQPEGMRNALARVTCQVGAAGN